MSFIAHSCIRTFCSSKYEQTDPDYVEKRVGKLADEYRNCPKEWKQTFIEGLTKEDKKELIERGVIPK